VRHAVTMIKGIALGAGMAYFLDPEQGAGRRRRVRAGLVSWILEIGDEADRLVSRVTENLAARGSSLAGTRVPPVRPAEWSPETRLAAGAIGALLTLTGLKLRAPLACLLGTFGLGLLAEDAFQSCPLSRRGEGSSSPAAPGNEVADERGWTVATP
jgi:hypothetical protein